MIKISEKYSIKINNSNFFNDSQLHEFKLKGNTLILDVYYKEMCLCCWVPCKKDLHGSIIIDYDYSYQTSKIMGLPPHVREKIEKYLKLLTFI